MSVFGRFSVLDRRKRIKKHAFSYGGSALLWIGEHEAKPLVLAKIFCLVRSDERSQHRLTGDQRSQRLAQSD